MTGGAMTGGGVTQGGLRGRGRGSLRGRLLLTYVGLIMLGAGGLTLIAGRQLALSAYNDFAASLQVQALLVASSLVEPLEEFEGGSASQVQTIINRYAAETGARITVIDMSGRARYDSAGTPPAGDLRDLAEIASAVAGTVTYDIRPDENGADTLYTAAPVVYEQRAVGYVRLAALAATPQATIYQRWLALGLAFAGVLLIALILSLWLAATLTQPLADLRGTALDLAAGNLERRVAKPGRDEIGAVAEAFNQMADRLTAMLAAQRAFASNAAHELRTPLTTVRLRTEALLNDQLDVPLQQQYIAEIDAEVMRLAGLVEDLSLLARLDAGQFTRGAAVVDPGRLAAQLQRELAPQAADQGVTLTLAPPPDLPPVAANLNHLRVVWRNLLDNGLKYTPAGGRVDWDLAREGGELRLTVRDSGRGIAAADLPRVGERFYRADKARSRQGPAGTGLGLALAESIVTAYGGRLIIDSPGEGRGTTAQVWWPLA